MERDRKNGEPSPSYWPSNVRPDAYYLGTVLEKTSCVSTSKDDGENVAKRGIFVPVGDVGRAAELLREHFDVDELCSRLKA